MGDAVQTVTRVAVVTGASRGIGKAIALRLARDGRHVVLVARSAPPLNDLKAQIEAAGGRASVKACDMGDAGEGGAVAKMIEQVAEEHGRLDILVNNAGITRDNLVLRMSDAEWDEVVRVNLTAAFAAIRAGARSMMRGKFGRIVNIASTSGVIGNAGQANYAASKAGLLGLTRSLAKEFGGRGVTVNTIAPGFIETDMTADLPEPIRKGALASIPLGRFGSAEDIAGAVGFLCSDSAAYITGQVLVVDGGMTL